MKSKVKNSFQFKGFCLLKKTKNQGENIFQEKR
jgi:hypothetical protein